MVLSIKEREESIQLLAMAPQVCGKLLTLQRKGNRVDVEALRDRIPLQQGARKGPQMGSHGYRRLRRWNQVFVDASVGLGIYEYIQVKELGQEVHEGPTRVGACPTPLGVPSVLVTPLWLLRLHLQVSWLSSDQRKIIAKVLFRLVFLFYETQKQAKNRNWHWALG